MMEHIPTWVLLIFPHGFVGLVSIAWLIGYCVSPRIKAFANAHTADPDLTWKALGIHVGVWMFAVQGSRDDLLFYSGFLVAVLCLVSAACVKQVMDNANLRK